MTDLPLLHELLDLILQWEERPEREPGGEGHFSRCVGKLGQRQCLFDHLRVIVARDVLHAGELCRPSGEHTVLVVVLREEDTVRRSQDRRRYLREELLLVEPGLA